MASKRYKRNFLKKVILRLDFENIEINSIEEFYNKDIKKSFPKSGLKMGQEGTFNFDVQTQQVSQTQNEFKIFTLENKDNSKRVEISGKYVFIEYDKYVSSKDLFKDAKEVIGEFISVYKVITVKRLGLRYINEIDLKQKDPLKWNEYINKDLIGNLEFATSKKDRVSRAMSQLVIKKDAGDITFNYGIFNKEFPNEVVVKEFILDLDCYSCVQFETSEEDIFNRISSYHGFIEDLFERSITERLRELLNK